MHAALLVVTLALLAAVAIPATAKEGVRAKLNAPVRIDNPAGKTIRVRWRLEDGEGHGFGAGGIYLRLHRGCGRRAMRVAAEGSTREYSVRVKVPRGGIRKIDVGLQGWRITAGHKERADVFFAFDPPLVSKRRASCA